MILYNRTNQIIITTGLKKLNTSLERALGLINPNLENGSEGVYFKTRWGIHTFFMKKSIDVLICDKEFRVRKCVLDLKPNRVLIWNPKYDNVFELVSSRSDHSQLSVGDKLEIYEKIP